MVPRKESALQESVVSPRVRIIHGKGTGTLRETVHSVLRRMPEVTSFRLASEAVAGGATIVILRRG